MSRKMQRGGTPRSVCPSKMNVRECTSEEICRWDEKKNKCYKKTVAQLRPLPIERKKPEIAAVVVSKPSCPVHKTQEECSRAETCQWNTKKHKCYKKPKSRINKKNALVAVPTMFKDGRIDVPNIDIFKGKPGPFQNCFSERTAAIYKSMTPLSYKGEILNGKLTRGVFTDRMGLVRYEGDLSECLPHGNGKFEKRMYEIIQEGVFENGAFKSGRQQFRDTIYNVIDNHIFIPPEQYHQYDFVISNKNLNKGTYITLLIYIHGSDIKDSVCKIHSPNKHVRVVSPIESGCENLANSQYIADVYNISYNVCNLKQNKNATSIQKIQKSVHLLNQINELFKVKPIFRPVMDHLYYSSEKDKTKGIFILDSSDVKADITAFRVKNKKDFIYGTDPENILPTIERQFGTHFFRSELVNYLLIKYDTVNIIDLSCRVLEDADAPKQVSAHAPYKCVYKQVGPNLEDDEIRSVQ
jgi:hypothetical protein